MISRVTRSTRYVNSSKPLPKRSVTIKPQTQASSVTKDGVVTKTVSPSTQASSVPAQTRELTWWDQASLVGEGIVNQATDYQGIVNPSYENRSILNKAIDRTIQGDFAGAGEIISQNPARFAGNVIFEAGTAIIPVGAVAKGVATGTKIARAGVKVSNKVTRSKNIIKRDQITPPKYFRDIKEVNRSIKQDKFKIPNSEMESKLYIRGGKNTRIDKSDEFTMLNYMETQPRLPTDVTIFNVADPRRVRDFFGRADNIRSMSDKIKPRSGINYIPNPLNIYQKADVAYKSSTGNFKRASIKRPKPNTGRV
jgi:hypothetical protein